MRENFIKSFFSYLGEIAAFILLLDSRYMYLHDDHMIEDSIVVFLIIWIFVVLLYKPINCIISLFVFPPFEKTNELPLTKNVIVEYLISIAVSVILYIVLNSSNEFIDKLNIFIK